MHWPVGNGCLAKLLPDRAVASALRPSLLGRQIGHLPFALAGPEGDALDAPDLDAERTRPAAVCRWIPGRPPRLQSESVNSSQPLAFRWQFLFSGLPLGNGLEHVAEQRLRTKIEKAYLGMISPHGLRVRLGPPEPRGYAVGHS